MSFQGWNELMISQEAAGANYASFTTAKTVINQQDLLPLPAGFFRIGRKLRITLHAALSNIVTTPGTVTFQVMLGTIVVWSSGAIQMNATSHVNLPMKLVVDLTCQLTNTTVGGVIAKLMGQGVLTGVHFTKTIAATDLWGRVSAADAAVSEAIINVPITAPALGTAFDSTIAQTLDFFVGFSISQPTNNITVAQYDVEVLN